MTEREALEVVQALARVDGFRSREDAWDFPLGGEVAYGLDNRAQIVSVEGFHTGTVDWRRGGRSASCDLDLTSSTSMEDDVLTIAGTACGIPVELSVRPE